ncbi:MAG: hypothetical protein ACI849_000818 [Patiriisocius sp.]|jgi:hypothetical protein
MFVTTFSNFFNIPTLGSFYTVALLCLVMPFNSLGQEDDLGTEVVNIVKPYSPTISDAFKVKETPVLNDSISTQKEEVAYRIFSVPVASTFTPAKGNAATVEKAKKIKLYDNYATLGFGNYTSILGALYSNFQLSRTDNVGVFFKHNSSLGDIDEVRTQSDYLDTQLDVNYSSRQRDASYGLDFGVQHQKYNWYGLNDSFGSSPDSFFDGLNVSQNYFSATLGGSIAVKDSYFEKAAVNLRYLGDSFSSSEFNISALPEFAFPLSDYNFKVGVDLDYLSGSFSEDIFLPGTKKYSQLNIGVLPSVSIVTNDLSLNLGVAAYLGLDGEANETDLYIYPNLSASYKVVDDLFIAYGGIEGGLVQNSFYGSKEVNPFVSPTLDINPTSTSYDAFAGVKGKVTNAIAYNVRAGYSNEKDKAFFKSNLYRSLNAIGRAGYTFGNSFGLVYDDVKTLSVFGELKSELSANLSIGVNATFNSYNTNNQAEAWNLPTLQATLFSTFNITESLYGGVSLFYVGERKDKDDNVVLGAVETIVTLDGYLDANIHLGYRLTERLSIFAKGSNLLGDNYQKWYNYPVQGIQVMGGATYAFDW